MEIIAHRGASHDAPENTLAAINLGWRQDADAVEVDVHLSRDGQLVVIHDNNTRRTGRVNNKVSAQTLAELRGLDVGRWKGTQWSGQRIPTLEEVLAIVPEGRRLFLELKCGPEGIPELVRVAGTSRRRPSPIVAIGFSRQTMKQLKAQMLELEVCWIVRFRRNWKTGRRFPARDEMIAAAQEAGLDGVDMDAGGPVDAPLVNQLKAAGLKVYVWTVDSVARARRLVAANVDGITTNRPQWLRQKLAL